MSYGHQNSQHEFPTESLPVAPPPARRPWYARKGFRIAAATTAITVTAATIAGIGVVHHLSNNVRSTAVDGLNSSPDMDGPLNILVVGSDERDGSIEAGDAEGRRSDSMMVVHLNAAHDKATGVQIPRDTMVTPPKGSAEYSSNPNQPIQINSLLEEGDSQLVAAVSGLTGMKLDHYVDVSFGGFMSIVDSLGGIDMCLPEAINDPDANLKVQAGCHTLHGKDALAMARTRHAIGDGSDLARIGHQQSVMKAILKKADKDSVLSDPLKMFDILDKASSAITVDDGLKNPSDLTALLRAFATVERDHVDFEQLPVVPYPWDTNRVELSDEGAALPKTLQHS